ncbi:MAG: VWA domain-containing protein, partial [Rhodobacterales bacterium]
MRFLAALGLLACFSTPLMAQDRASAVLVLDGSGSMWGQIDGVAKITIAQDVVGDLLQVIPEEQALGLTVYGHRRKGDCSDIETLVAPGMGTRDAIAAAVNAIKPKGKTPMTDAVIAAAQSLRYTEEKATVILVSDGIETCNPDPCAAARALEEAGVDFTAHVIGFNVNDPSAVAQMQCLAAETGGTFRLADDAAELGEALEIVVAPEPVTVSFRATEGQNGAEIGSGLIWNFAPEGTGQQTAPTGSTQLALLPGDYSVSVLRLADEATADARFTVGDTAATITLVLPELTPAATLEAPAAAVAGSEIEVAWSGPNNSDDYIALAAVGSDVNEEFYYEYTNAGTPVTLRMPVEPGAYELRYIANGNVKKILASRPITGTAPAASLEAPETAVAGSEIEVTWMGPGNQDDY